MNTIPSKKLAGSYAHAYYELATATAVSGRPQLATTIVKAWRAIKASDEPNEQTPSGNVRPKTRKRCQIERARVDMLLRLLADWPDYPLGTTTSTVEERLRRELYGTDDPWIGSSHSYSHKSDVPW